MVSPSPSAQLASLRPDIKEAMMLFNIQLNIERMIGLKVFPVLEVDKQGGSFPKVKVESLMKDVETARASGGGYHMAETDFEDDMFATKENGITIPVDRRNANIYSEFQSAVSTANFARSLVLTKMERRIASQVFDTGAFTPTNAATSWSDLENAEPIADVEDAVQRLYSKGIMANALVMSWKRFRNLRNTFQIIDRVTANGAGSPAKPSDITMQMMAEVFDLQYILVGGAQYNAAKEGQVKNLQPIWSDSYCAVTRVAQAGSTLEDACIGRTFHWGGDGSLIDGTIETYYDEEIRGDKVRYRMETQEKILYDEACELIAV